MPRKGIEPIRREQIFRATTAVIAREGFAGTTMRGVAEEAGVSTGMLNHYFANRQDMLAQTLVAVSERVQARVRNAIEDVPAGPSRVRAFVDAALPRDAAMVASWRVWIAAYGEAVRSPRLRAEIEQRLEPWWALIDEALADAVPADALEDDGIPVSWRFDALLNGFVIQVLTASSELQLDDVRDEMVHAFTAVLGAR